MELRPADGMIAILSVTGEWSQRTGLTTFTLLPHRRRVITAKAIACVGVAMVTIPLAFGIGALGNLVGTAIGRGEPVWDLRVTNLLTIVLANVLSVLVGFMLGVVIRSSAGALGAYFIYQFVFPTLALLLATSQGWFRDLEPWLDFDYAQTPCSREH
jgi:ABC-type transport system involved in multi-copper enzyme maturation permease subunit